MYQALYRKWRPQTFTDVIGQEHITSVLQYQAENNKVSHAYLFCGSRGTGKTTCAKLLSKAANCTNLKNGNPCNECEACVSINNATSLDVAELDAASNNRVDDIRRLCEEIVYPPAALKKRVYIVDEVHMLTPQAFNALLKTLEEPPEHAIFILATTELQKVPATIVSRCQRYDFSRIHKEKIVDRLMTICSEEGINLDREAAFVIANLSDGAMRDALSLLESCASNNSYISKEYIINLLGLSNREKLLELLYSCAKQNTSRSLALLEELYSKTGDLTTSFAELLDICKDVLVIQNVSSASLYVNVSDDEMKSLKEIADNISHDTLIYFVKEIERFLSDSTAYGINKKTVAEIAVVKMTTPASSNDTEALLARLSALESGAPVKREEKKAPTAPKKEEKQVEQPAPAPKKKQTGNKDIFEYVNEFVRRFGEKEIMTRFYMEGAVIKKVGTALKIYCSEIGASTMKMSKADLTALDIAKELDPTIESVEIISNEELGKENDTNNDLLQFEN